MLPRGTTDWRGHAAEPPWGYGPLALLRQEVEDAGMRLTVIEDNPPMDRLRLGLPGREEELDAVLELLRTMGTARHRGVVLQLDGGGPVVPDVDRHPDPRRRDRDGFDLATVGRRPGRARGPGPEERLWETLAWFLERAVPVAEEAGVRLALHPDDPPLSPLRGIGRIIRSLDAYDRVFELHPSPANGMTMCQGNVALMTDDLPAAIRRFGTQGRIHFVHFRDVRGTPERFVETFVDDGPTDMAACVRAYVETGVDAPLRTDHSPALDRRRLGRARVSDPRPAPRRRLRAGAARGHEQRLIRTRPRTR